MRRQRIDAGLELVAFVSPLVATVAISAHCFKSHSNNLLLFELNSLQPLKELRRAFATSPDERRAISMETHKLRDQKKVLLCVLMTLDR